MLCMYVYCHCRQQVWILTKCEEFARSCHHPSSVSALHGVLDVFVLAHVLFTRTVLEPNDFHNHTQDHGRLHVHMYMEN